MAVIVDFTFGTVYAFREGFYSRSLAIEVT